MAKGRILAIDDERFFRRFYEDLLGAEGYRVVTALSGSKGLDHVYREEFDLIILDMDLGEENSLEVAELIRQLSPDQEIMAVTRQKDVNLAVQAMKKGVTEYLLKPIDPEAFLLLINKILFRQALKCEHSKLIDENVDYFSILASYRKCLDLLKIHGLDRLADFIADLMMEILQADGAALWLFRDMANHYRLRCARGLANVPPEKNIFQPTEAERCAFSSGEAMFGDGAATLQVPINFGNETLALVQVEAPSGRKNFNRRDLKVATMVAEIAATGLHNVLLFRSLERNILRSPGSEAYNMVFFRDYASKEIHKAQRYGRDLSISKLRIKNYAQLKGAFQDREVEEGIGSLVNAINITLREADIIAKDGPDEFFIFLPETDYWGALLAQRRILRILKSKLMVHSLKKSLPIKVVMRSASCSLDGNSFKQLTETAEERLRELDSSLIFKYGLEELPFWESVDKLMGEIPHDCPGDSAYFQDCHVSITEESVERVFQSFYHELIEANRVRGFIYYGCGNFERVREQLPHLGRIENSATSIFLLGGSQRENWSYQRIVPIYISEPNFTEAPFFLYLSEEFAYALLTRRKGDKWFGFHSSDFYFVESMILKLQEQYRLQEEI
ncbi:MAG: response regulator [Deltaproteobacteria bacterium]|nr:response regulator [Deltaproteobacteria bacterium]